MVSRGGRAGTREGAVQPGRHVLQQAHAAVSRVAGVSEVPVAGAIVVTTPQQVSLADTRRAVRMYQKLNIPVLGLVENMSYFACPSCQHESDIFGRGGGEETAGQMEIAFLGRIPIYEPIRRGSDAGQPVVLSEPDCVAAQAFLRVAEQAAAQVSIASYLVADPRSPASSSP